MHNAKEALIYEATTLPVEIRNKIIKNIQISFHFEDGTMHHVKPGDKISKALAVNCLRGIHILGHLENWQFLNEEDTEI